jgi:peptidoglycan/xylan/chitin deacetylase (PgdA/CDA1 family)
VRKSITITAGLGAVALGAVAANSAPSVLALSSIGRRVAPGLAGVGTRGHVAITFDDGPDPESTPAFLAVLDSLGWRATFFMLGSMVEAAPALAAEVADAGHELGVHGFDHRTHLRLGPRATRDEIARGRDAIVEATGVVPEWFRPPYGTLSVSALLAARSMGLRTVLWSSWGRDWRQGATGASVVEDVMSGLVDGGTVLLHDSDCTSSPGSWRAALEALPLLAKCFADAGLAVGPAGEHGLAS